MTDKTRPKDLTNGLSQKEFDKVNRALKDPHKCSVSLLDFFAGVAFLGYAVNKFEDIHIPEGSTLGEEVSRESYAWAKVMWEAKINI